MLFKRLRNKKGFSLTELIFAGSIAVVIMITIMSAWIFAYRTWKEETVQTDLRVDLMSSLERIKSDLRLSSLTYMVFYPEDASTYTAVSLPKASVDANGLFGMNTNEEIDWEETIVYFVGTDDDGNDVLKRIVIDPRDNSLTPEEHYTQLENIVTSGAGPSGSTEEEFLENIDTFAITSLAPYIDFYESSTTPVRAGKIVFGWAKLSAGNHTVKLEVTGKNSLSSGYDLGIDSISIEPAGSVRDVEYYSSAYAPSGMISTSGGSVNRVHSSVWSNDNYLELASASVGSYIAFTDYYDLWRESAFMAVSQNNTEKIGEEVRISLEIPELDEQGELGWFGYTEAGSSDQDGVSSGFPGGVAAPVTIRTVVTQDNIDSDVDMIRVSFKASETNPLVVDKAYITKRNGTAGFDGLANQATGALDVENYHRHQQLFFYDSSGSVTESVTIAADSEEWSLWTAFPLRNDSDYLISMYVSDAASVDCTAWSNIDATARTYYLTGSTTTAAGTPDWTAGAIVPGSDDDIFINAQIDTWVMAGTVESQICDTTIADPTYSNIKWSENLPSGTDVLLKARSSDDEYMTGATDWDSIAASSSNPNGLSIGAGRYLQFMAELVTDPFWGSGAAVLSYSNYVDAQVALSVYDFPTNTGVYYITKANVPWLDDVQIDWPGVDRICTITGYIGRKNDYGQAKITVDGSDLVKILSLHLRVAQEWQSKTISAENIIDIEPRNTGK
jgi:hypothetical protein